MSVLKTENLTKKFGQFTALNHVNIEVQEGEVFGFIGPNGAGKTTTTRILLGMYKANEGSATIFGKDCWQSPVDIHKKLAFVPGDVNLWLNLTGGEVIDFLLKLNGINDKFRKEEYIKRFDLDVTKKCKTYSKGNRQKVALVAAFASNADFYIFDEPTSGLDPLMEKIFQECVLEEKNAGKTILLSSHILSEVEQLCDRVSIIRHGKIIETGTLEKLRRLTRTNVQATTAKQIVGITDVKGVYNYTEDGQKCLLQVDTEEIGNVVKFISNFEVEKIEVTPLSLEDLFMHYYNEG